MTRAVKILRPESGEQIERAQKLIIKQQRRIEQMQEEINSRLQRIHNESLLILAEIEEMRTGEIRTVSKELEEQIKRASRIAVAIDRKVED